MAVLVENITDSPENYTRFFVLGRDPTVPKDPAKTSIVFAAENAPEALYHHLEPFAVRGIDLTKIESSPVRKQRWECLFYVDFAGASERNGVGKPWRSYGGGPHSS